MKSTWKNPQFRAAFPVLVVALGLVTSVLTGHFQRFVALRFGAPLVVAVLDTGVDARIPAIASRVVTDAKGPVGWNFFDANNDTSDTDGHGTKVTLFVIQNCGDCKILPLKTSRSGAGITPDDLTKAIRFALDHGAQVINISSGLTQGSADLESAVREAKAKGALIITAAGTGIKNPFRPENLSQIYPQSYPDVIVVGAAKSLAEADPLMNFGEKLDLVIVGQPSETFGSSFAAAVVSGAVALKKRGYPSLSVEKARKLLRDTAQKPAQPSPRLGAGAFDLERFLGANP